MYTDCRENKKSTNLRVFQTFCAFLIPNITNLIRIFHAIQHGLHIHSAVIDIHVFPPTFFLVSSFYFELVLPSFSSSHIVSMTKSKLLKKNIKSSVHGEHQNSTEKRKIQKQQENERERERV